MPAFDIASIEQLAQQLDNPIVARYKLYGGDVELLYNDKEHTYGTEREGVFVPAAGVTSVTGTLDKPALPPWAAKMTMLYALEKFKGVKFNKNDDPLYPMVPELPFEQVEKWLFEAKANYRNISAQALDIGHMSHEWIEGYLKNVRDGISNADRALPENEKARKCSQAAVEWISKHNLRPVWIEKKIYSRLYNYAGTFDLVAIMGNCSDVSCCGCIDRETFERVPVLFKNARCLVDWKSSNGMYNEYRFQTASYKVGWDEEFPDQPIEYRFVIKLGKEDGKFGSYLLMPEDQTKDFGVFKGLLTAYNRVNEIAALERDSKNLAKALDKARKLTEKANEKAAKAAVKAAKKGVN